MQAALDAVPERVATPVLAQGQLPKPALIDAFTDDESASLFATMGFWQGIDVPGRTLSLRRRRPPAVPPPRRPAAPGPPRPRRPGPRPSALVDLPRAATLLAQGAGRLIRTATDRGVVAVLDPRLGKAGYRWDIVRALPPMRRTRHRAEAEAFLREIAAYGRVRDLTTRAGQPVKVAILRHRHRRCRAGRPRRSARRPVAPS